MSQEISDTEEEILVYVEFDDGVNIEKYRTVHVLGIDGENPIIQMDETFFTGKFEDTLGTYMFLEEDPDPKSTDVLFDKIPEKNLKYDCMTRKYLKMEHAYVSPKEGHSVNSNTDKTEDDLTTVHFKTLQEAIDTFKSKWDKIGVNQ